jgi:hypothetical protein
MRVAQFTVEMIDVRLIDLSIEVLTAEQNPDRYSPEGLALSPNVALSLAAGLSVRFLVVVGNGPPFVSVLFEELSDGQFEIFPRFGARHRMLPESRTSQTVQSIAKLKKESRRCTGIRLLQRPGFWRLKPACLGCEPARRRCMGLGRPDFTPSTDMSDSFITLASVRACLWAKSIRVETEGDSDNVTVYWKDGDLVASTTPEIVLSVINVLPTDCPPALFFDRLVAAGTRVRQAKTGQIYKPEIPPEEIEPRELSQFVLTVVGGPYGDFTINAPALSAANSPAVDTRRYWPTVGSYADIAESDFKGHVEFTFAEKPPPVYRLLARSAVGDTLYSTIEFVRTSSGHSSSATSDVTLVPAFTIVWDPELVPPETYARLVTAIGDVARTFGAVGVQRAGSRGFNVPVEVEVPR